MLTRIEIDGFKSFRDLKLDLQPFTVIAGANASGKSNLFDALRLLSRLCTYNVAEAFQGLRGDPTELFSRDANGAYGKAIKFAAEVLLDADIEDAFGQKRALTYTRLRYEIEVERREEEAGGLERLYVRREEAQIILRKNDNWLKLRHSPSREFASRHAKYAKGGGRSPFLQTLPDRFQANQDGVAGRPRPFPISRDRATASVLSRITTATEFPHLFALRHELSGISFLQLEAAAERKPSDALAPDELLPDGSNLARVLSRIESETRTPARPSGDLSFIRNSLAGLISGVQDLRVERDVSGRAYRIFLRMKDEAEFSSSVLSDGTLRLLALVTYLQDKRRSGILLFEEPENGVQEDRIIRLVEMLRNATVDIESIEKHTTKLYQIILNTHSPVVLQCVEPHELVIADVVTMIDIRSAHPARRSRMRSGVVDQLDLNDEFDREHHITRSEALRALKKGGASA
jgi:predicted ATPase